MNRWLTRRWPAPHWPSVAGRGRTDAGPLLLTAAVIAAVALLAGAVPALLRAAADDAVQDTVRRAGGDSNVLVHANWERDDGPTGGRVRTPRLAEDVDDFRARATDALEPELAAALLPPIAVVNGPILNITDGSVLRTFQLSYLAGDPGGPDVTWIAGSAPGPAVADRSVEIPYTGPPWLVQVGLSEADAAALGLGPGDRIPVKDAQGHDKNVQISGIYRPVDSADPGWRLAPALLRPVPGADGVGTTRFAGLLSRESLPDARLAFDDDQLRRSVHFAPEPGTLTWDTTATLASQVVRLKAASGSSSVRDQSLKWESQLDTVLRDARTRISAASAQAAVLLAGVLTATVLVLLLAADLLVRRRGPALSAARQRGAALPDLGAELLVESAVVSLSAAAVGLALARAVAPGVSWTWTVPVVLAGALAGPAFGTLAAARASRDRRQPANRAARRWIRATGELRRAAVEAAVLIAAVAALVTLHQRRLLPTAPDGDTGALSGDLVIPTSALALGVLAGALVLLRLLPVGTRFALRQALRSRRPLAVFGAARAATTAGRALPLLVLVSTTALASFALVAGTTTERGLADGAWTSVGADARLDIGADAAAATPALAERLAAAPGVRQVVVAQVTDSARIVADSTLVTPRLVIVDTAAFQRLLAATPLPDAPALARLTTPGPHPGDIPALVRSSDGAMRTGSRLQLPRDGTAPAIRLAAVGAAPSVGGASDVVVVDAAALADAGLPAVPNTVWVTGPGAAEAVSNTGVAADVVLRADVLRAQRAAPLTAGLLRLAWTAAVVLLVLGLLGLALGAAAGAAERWQTLTRLRTLGLRPRDARWVAAGELLPPVAVASVYGPLLGILLAHLTLGPLDLRLLTGQAADPAAVLPWWLLGLVSVALLAAAATVVPVESALRRRDRLGEVLRAGE